MSEQEPGHWGKDYTPFSPLAETLLAYYVGDERAFVTASARAHIRCPEWEATGKVHDWRNYVDDPVCECWHELSDEARVIIYGMAACTADREEWD